MLKRCQILLDEWQVEHLKRSVEALDFSFSEVVRIFVSEAILSILFSIEPDKKIGITLDELTALKKKVLDPETTQEERHQLISKVYFEARKASEHSVGWIEPNK